MIVHAGGVSMQLVNLQAMMKIARKIIKILTVQFHVSLCPISTVDAGFVHFLGRSLLQHQTLCVCTCFPRCWCFHSTSESSSYDENCKKNCKNPNSVISCFVMSYLNC